MRLPRLRGDETALAYGLLIDENCPGLLRFHANMLIARHALPARQSGCREHLHSMANGEDPFPQPIELAHDFDQLHIVPQVLRSPAAEDEHRGIILDLNVVEFHAGFQSVSAPLDVRGPSMLKMVHHHVDPSSRWR